MDNLMETVKAMPKMLSGEELASALTILPEYNESIRNESESVRLMALSDLYTIYLPSQMSMEIYSKLYLSLLRSLQKKNTTLAIQQRYQNNRAIQQQAYNGIMGGSDSYTIIGASGIGKSNPDQHEGDFIKFSEKILRVIEDDGIVGFRIATKGNYDNVVFASIIHLRTIRVCLKMIR